MEYELTPRLKKVVALRRLAALLTLFGVPFGVYNWLPHGTAFEWIILAVVSALGVFFLFKLLEVAIVWVVYGFNPQLMYDDAQNVIAQQQKRMAKVEEPEPTENPAMQMEFTIEELPPAPIGHYYDAEIYEWIKVRSPQGNLVTAYFEDTINPKQMATYAIPDGHMLIPPGILFRLEFPEDEEVKEENAAG
jgi:hypothetical protein